MTRRATIIPLLVPLLVVLGIFAVSCLTPFTAAAGKSPDQNEPLQIAVAANFKDCLQEILTAYTEQGGWPAVLIVGSTGRHFAQIRNGAPFDLFFAADEECPRLLEEGGYAVQGSRFTYAVGCLVLWAPGVEFERGSNVADVLAAGDFHHLAIANPRLAPYGLAAKQALQELGLWETLADRFVTGQSVGQAWQFVASGAAEAGLLAASQTKFLDDPAEIIPIPARLHEPIVQQAVLLARAAENPVARDFLAFVQGPVASALIRAAGYGVPEGSAP